MSALPERKPENVPYHTFTRMMWQEGARLSRRFTSEEADLYEGSEIHVWTCKNGKIILTQPWDRGGFEIYYPDDEHRILECIAKAIAYGKPNQ